MKKNISLISVLSGFAILVAGSLIISSCEGPQGPPGLDGTNGVDGINGVDGKDANETCIICHNADVVLYAKEQQASSSMHTSGDTYARNHADCAICHTHQGFVETLESGDLEASADIEDPAPINCRTCHNIHETYTEADWALVTYDAVDTDFGDFTIDIGGNSNLCVNCHQFRPVDPMPVVGGGDVSITSSRWGPHHGPQGNVLYGVGGYEVAGSKNYPAPGSAAHASIGCTYCHMGAMPYNTPEVGGHTFNVAVDGEDGNTYVCETCHIDIEENDFDYNGLQSEIDDLLSQLETIFVARGIIDEPGDLWNASSGTPLVVSADEAGAMLNYDMIEQDRSHGVHNPFYTVALLTNTVESLQ